VQPQNHVGFASAGVSTTDALVGDRFQRIRVCGKLCRKGTLRRKLTMRITPAAALAMKLRGLGILMGMILLVTILIAPAMAQQGDLNAIFKRFSELYRAGDYPAALIEAQKFEAVVKARFGVNHSNYGSALNNLALVYQAQGNYAEAEALDKRTLAIKEHTLGTGHRDVATSLYNLAHVYQLEGKYNEAEKLYKRALAIGEKALGAGHPDVANTVNGLALVYHLRGDYTNAEELYKRAIGILRRGTPQARTSD